MPIQLELEDDQYEFHGFNHVRKVARAIVLDDDGLVAIHCIHRNDMFCNQSYYETPGGGVDEGETFEEAVVRECEEELGEKIEVLKYIGEVVDAYNLIGRKNINRFYLCRFVKKTKAHFESEGDTMIQKTIHVSLDQAIALYEGQDDTLVSGLVKRRELPILLETKKMLQNL